MLAQEEARLLNHNYIGTEHILLGLIHEGEGVAAKALESLGHLARGRAQPGRGDHRPGRLVALGAHPLHASGQEGPGAVAARSPAARPQLHRHRAHPARAHPRGRGRRRPGAREAGRRPQPGAPAGHPAPVGLPGPPGRQGGRGRSGRRRSRPAGRAGPGRLAGARPVRSQPHAARPREEARSGDRAHARARARHAGAQPPHEEQPGPHRRARRRQDGHRRGPGPEDRGQRRPRDAQGQAALHPRPRRPRGRLAATAATSRSA